MTADGRIHDRGNGDISHSEGQGYGMLLAVANNDRAAFDALWHWTDQTLQRDDVRLFSWRYDPKAAKKIGDPNNASDGDLLIAWALIEASRRWDDPQFAQASGEIRAAIRDHLVHDVNGRKILLPGLTGFVQSQAVLVNPSYIVAPALAAFAKADPSGPWGAILSDGYALLREARFGTFRLAPDWLALKADGHMEPATKWPPRFGYDAIRVPLYAIWAKAPADLIEPSTAYWSSLNAAGRPQPAWIDVRSDKTASYPASTGARAIAALTAGRPLPDFPAAEDYYSTVLWLLAEQAGQKAFME